MNYQNELKRICMEHELWLDSNGENGTRANFHYLDLRNAEFNGENLEKANFSHSWLDNARFRRAKLRGANFTKAAASAADFRGADMEEADLSWACIRESVFYEAVLEKASLGYATLAGSTFARSNLRKARFVGADIRSADFMDADIEGARFDDAILAGCCLYNARPVCAMDRERAMNGTVITPEGSIIGWKKCWILGGNGGTCIAKLRIPEAAKRSNATGRKCRAEYVEVLEVIGAEAGYTDSMKRTEYHPGTVVRADRFDDNRWNECSNGIHFFLTRGEAENYEF